MKAFFRLLGVVFVIYSAIFLMKFLQKSFDDGDLRRARESLDRLQIAEKTVWQAMANELAVPLENLHCEEWLLSRYSGPVRFDCYAATDKTQSYVWDVDVVGFRVTPANPRSKTLWERK